MPTLELGAGGLVMGTMGDNPKSSKQRAKKVKKKKTGPRERFWTAGGDGGILPRAKILPKRIAGRREKLLRGVRLE